MPSRKQRRLESAVAAVQNRYGTQALQKAADVARRPLPPHIPTGFTALDAITGCAGLPLDANVLLTGKMTSGKLTLAYKTLAQAQTPLAKSKMKPAVAILDLAHTTNPDYLHRCGLDLTQVLIAQPTTINHAVDLVLDLVRSRGVRAVLVDSLVELATHPRGLRYLSTHLGKLANYLDDSGCLVLWIDEPEPAWKRLVNWDRGAVLRPHAALHLTFQQEAWCQQRKGLAGYQAEVRVQKSRWAQTDRTATIRIAFNGTVRAQPTW